MRSLFHIFCCTVCIAAAVGWSSIECPIQIAVNTVYTVEGTLNDTLTIRSKRINGTDTILYNRGIDLTKFSIPVSYQSPVDTLVFETIRLAAIDTVWLEKQDIPHFESVDCSALFFHNITAVRSTHIGIDTIIITNPTVDYDPSNPHLYIRFKARP